MYSTIKIIIIKRGNMKKRKIGRQKMVVFQVMTGSPTVIQ